MKATRKNLTADSADNTDVEESGHHRFFSVSAKSALSAVTPIEQAAALYHRDGRNFLDVVQEHLDNGIVIDRPECFALAQGVQLDDGRFAWMVNVAAGNLRELVRHIPWWLPWIAFYRQKFGIENKGKTLKVYPLQKFIHRGLRG